MLQTKKYTPIRASLVQVLAEQVGQEPFRSLFWVVRLPSDIIYKMYTVFFATGNKEKMLIAETVCSKFRIEVKQANIEIDEIQGEDLVAIVKDKVQRAYKGLSTPVVCGNPTNSHFI